MKCSQKHKLRRSQRQCTFHGTFLTPCFLWILSLTHSASVSSCPLSFFPPSPVPHSLPLVCCVGSEPSLAARERRGGGGRGGGRENGRLSLHGAPLTSQRYPGEQCLCLCVGQQALVAKSSVALPVSYSDSNVWGFFFPFDDSHMYCIHLFVMNQ